PAVYHEVAMIALRAGLAKEGLRWLQSALQVDPNHIPTHRALVIFYQETGSPILAAHHRAVAQRLSAGKPKGERSGPLLNSPQRLGPLHRSSAAAGDCFLPCSVRSLSSSWEAGMPGHGINSARAALNWCAIIPNSHGSTWSAVWRSGRTVSTHS